MYSGDSAYVHSSNSAESSLRFEASAANVLACAQIVNCVFLLSVEMTMGKGQVSETFVLIPL